MVAGGRAGSSSADGLEALTVTDEKPFGVFTVAQVQTLLDYCTTAADVWGVNQRRPRPANAANEPERVLTGATRGLVYYFAVCPRLYARTSYGRSQWLRYGLSATSEPAS